GWGGGCLLRRHRLQPDAAHVMARLNLVRRWDRHMAFGNGEAAASGERAAGRKVDQLRNAARNRGELAALLRKQAWTGREQAQRVGMHAMGEHRLGRAAL